MNKRRAVASKPAMLRALLVGLAIVLGLAVTARPAHADNVDALIKDLKSGSDYKIRLSAVLALAKLGDKRAIEPLADALGDRDKTVRGASAVALGKLVDASVSMALREKILAGLDALEKRESASSIKTQAQKTRAIVKGLAPPPAPAAAPGKGAIYVDVGAMAATVEPSAALKTLMRKTAQGMLKSKGAEMLQTWPGGKNPGKKDLDAKGVRGFHVDGTVNELVVKQKGSTATVSCKISMLIATYPEKSIFAVLSGGAAVQGSNDAKDIELAGKDCVAAVIEDLVATKVVPTIRSKAKQ